MRDLGFNERGERIHEIDEEEEEVVDLAQITSENSGGDIEMTEINTSNTQSQLISKENLKSRTTVKDSSLDFLD
jgi:hypothetical protein